jgi:hypothetical protein
MHHRKTNAYFTDLPFGGQLALWGVRLWVREMTDGTQDHATLRNGFELAGVPAAHTALDGLMTVIATTATGPIDIRCPDCRELSEDERLLMDVLAEQQAAEHSARHTLFAYRLPPAARRIGMDWAARLAAILGKAGLMIGLNNQLSGAAPSSGVSSLAVTIH